MPTPIPFAAWEPDKSDRANPAAEAKGVISQAGQYAPFPDIQDYGEDAATDAVCLGARAVYDSTKTPHIFMGDSTKLYELQSRVATDVSDSGGYTLGSEDGWQFAQFGDNVIAVAASEQPQSRFMGTSSPVDFTVHWSAFNDFDEWTPDPGTQAGNQELDQEQGEILTLIGLDYAAIFQERAIRRAIYVGPPVIFDFGQDYIEKARGCISRNAAAPYGRTIFYASDDGFYAFDGQASIPIGDGKVDKYFTSRLNYAFRHKVCVGIDGIRNLAVFGFPAGSSQVISELLIFSIRDGRWTHDVLDLEHLFDTPAEPFTVDNFDDLFTANDLDGVISPDNVDSGVFDDRRRRLAGVQTSTHRLGLFTGGARAATIETGEAELSPGRRAMVTEVWPLGDFPAGSVSASVGYRLALPGATKTYTNATQMNRAGFCPQRIDARFGSLRLQVGAGAAWRRAEGVHVTAVQTGGR